MIPTLFSFSSSTHPSLTTIRPSRPAKGASSSSSSCGSVSARPMTLPLPSQNCPWSSHSAPSFESLLASPSTSFPTGLPSAVTMKPVLLHLRPSRIDSGGSSGPVSSSGCSSTSWVIISTFPITLPSLSKTSPFEFIFLPAQSASSPSDSLAIGSPSSLTTSPFLLTLRPSRMDRSAVSSPGTSSPAAAAASSAALPISSSLPITFPSLSRTSPLALTFLPAQSAISPSESWAIGSPSSSSTWPFLLTFKPSRMDRSGAAASAAPAASSAAALASAAAASAFSTSSG